MLSLFYMMSFWHSSKPPTVEVPLTELATPAIEYVKKTPQDVLFGSGNYFVNLGNQRLAEINSIHSKEYFSSKKNKKFPMLSRQLSISKSSLPRS